MVQPRLSNYCVLLKLNFPTLLVPSEQWTFSHLLSGGKVPLASPFLWAGRATIPKNWHLLHWSNIRQLPLGYQSSRRWLWYGVLWLLWVLSGWLLMINAIVDVYKTESFLRPTVKEAPASKPARLTGKREARWIQDDMQEWVNQGFQWGPGSEGACKSPCPCEKSEAMTLAGLYCLRASIGQPVLLGRGESCTKQAPSQVRMSEVGQGDGHVSCPPCIVVLLPPTLDGCWCKCETG